MAHHDPTTAPGPGAVTGRELWQEYGDRWDIAFQPDLRVWSAERRSADGRERRFISERTPAVLAGKLAAAETATR
jgi:hypothetical protein